MAVPAIGSLAVHGALLAALVFYGVMSGLFHHNEWGGEGAGGAMHVTLQSNAIPLPDNQPLNQNVLATETPSQAPAPPAPKAAEKVDESAIAIQGKKAKPQEKTTPKTQQHQPNPQQNRAAFGEQAGTNIPRSMQPQSGSNGPTAVGDNDFASRFGWYVDQINRKMASNWYKQEVDPHTPRGARVYLVFTIHKAAARPNVQLYRSSGSPTLDRSASAACSALTLSASLPAAYNQNSH